MPLTSHPVIRLDAATVLLQWATGGLAFTWFTTRHREVGLGYGWLLRGTYALMAMGSVAVVTVTDLSWWRGLAAASVAGAALVALAVSVLRRDAGVSGHQAEHDRRSERVAMMTGIEREGSQREPDATDRGPEFPPRLDVVAPLIGAAGLVAAALDDAGAGADTAALSVARVLVGALFLGAISDAMLLGHWYLVQPGLPRRLLNELVRAVLWVLPVEVALLLVPTGMVQVLTGSVDDGWGGLLGWFWVACAVTTAVLCVVTRAALRERSYSAVMAATGLLYLAVLTAFGTDLVARAVLAS